VAAAQSNKSQLRIGRLTKAHGLKGGIKVEMFTDDPDGRFTPGAVFTLQVPDSSAWHNKTIELVELKWYNSHAVAFFKDVPDRSVAETLIKAILWVDHDLSEVPEEEDAWFDHQLLGLEVLRDGVKVGTVTAIDHFPAQDLLTVKTENGDVLVPFVKAIVSAVDVKAGTLTVTPPVGLFEELPDDEQPGAEKLVEYIEPSDDDDDAAPSGDDDTDTDEKPAT
jgi:16S rRNA processing protein RimM